MSSDGVAMVSGTPERGGVGDDAGALSGVEAAEAMLSLASGTNLSHSYGIVTGTFIRLQIRAQFSRKNRRC